MRPALRGSPLWIMATYPQIFDPLQAVAGEDDGAALGLAAEGASANTLGAD